MKVIKSIILIMAITMALTLTLLTTTNIEQQPTKVVDVESSFEANKNVGAVQTTRTIKRVSRFLQEKERNPRAADHCRKDNEVCHDILDAKNATCCNNKCVDLGYDKHNCGACKKKCAVTETCCRGECVNLSFDKRHCGYCNHRCMTGGYCIYGICDYA